MIENLVSSPVRWLVSQQEAVEPRSELNLFREVLALATFHYFLHPRDLHDTDFISARLSVHLWQMYVAACIISSVPTIHGSATCPCSGSFPHQTGREDEKNRTDLC